MAKARKTWKLVLTSIILSIIILAAFTAVFISFVVPAYEITKDQIYSVLTKALPILIGLIFLEIALISSRRSDDDYLDNIDKLAPNAYDSPLYTKPLDDPMSANRANPKEYDVTINNGEGAKETVREVPVEIIKEVIKEVPKEIIREIPVPVEKIVEKPVEVIKEVIKEVPIEVIKEVQVPVIKEIPAEKSSSDADIIIRHDSKVVEVEVPIEKIVEKEVPVDVIKETVIQNDVPLHREPEVKEVPVEKIVEKIVEVQEEPELGLEDALSEEIKASRDGGYSLVIASFPLSAENEIPSLFGVPAITFADKCYAILPYTRVKDIQKDLKAQNGKAILISQRHTPQSIIKELEK